MRFIFLPLLVAVAGCASKPQPRIVFEPPFPPPAVEPVTSVRHQEVIRAYHLGRFVVPSQPDLMHEYHPIYRVEAYSQWNLKPGATDAAGAVNPINPPPSAAYSPPTTNDVVLAELKRQKDATERVMWEAHQLAKSYDELQKVLRDMQAVAKDHVTLKGLILLSDKRVTQMQEELRKLATPLPTSTPELAAEAIPEPKEGPRPP